MNLTLVKMSNSIEKSHVEVGDLDTGSMDTAQLIQFFRASAESNAVLSGKIAMFPFAANVLTKETDRSIEA